MKGHKRLLEATNHGHYFADCGCGESLGVYASRAMASAAHAAHLMGQESKGKVAPTFLVGPPVKGMEHSQ